MSILQNKVKPQSILLQHNILQIQWNIIQYNIKYANTQWGHFVTWMQYFYRSHLTRLTFYVTVLATAVAGDIMLLGCPSGRPIFLNAISGLL